MITDDREVLNEVLVECGMEVMLAFVNGLGIEVRFPFSPIAGCSIPPEFRCGTEDCPECVALPAASSWNINTPGARISRTPLRLRFGYSPNPGSPQMKHLKAAAHTCLVLTLAACGGGGHLSVKNSGGGK